MYADNGCRDKKGSFKNKKKKFDLIQAPLAPIPLAVLAALGSGPAAANQIVTDGRTRTAIEVAGAVTDIRTETVRGRSAFNSFRHFRVAEGNTVNLHLPDGTRNLINLVHDSRAVIDGTLNGVLDGRIGGHVVFADPHGVVVGASGVINVGSLLLAAPTADFLDQVISPTGEIGEDAAARLLAGEAPRSADGDIRVEGVVNALETIAIEGTDVAVDGALRAASPEARRALFEAAVNTDGIEEGVEARIEGGEIVIAGAGDVVLDGELDVGAVEGGDGGVVTVRAGRDVIVGAGARLDASGAGADSDGGRIDVCADRDAYLRQGAQLAAAADVSGDGGFIEVSAERRVEIAPAAIDVSGAGGGEGGLFYVDPDEIVLIAGQYEPGSAAAGLSWAGGHALLAADESITLKSGAVINSRQVAGGDANSDTALSVGDSGDITLIAPEITLEQGSRLLAFANNGYQAGDIRLQALRRIEAADYIAAVSAAEARIDVAGELRGGDIELWAVAEITAEPSDPINDIAAALPEAFNAKFTELKAQLPDIGFAFADARGDAVIDIRDTAVIEASGDLRAHAEASRSVRAVADAGDTGVGASAAFGWLGGETRISVQAGADLDVGGVLALRAESTNTLEVTADTAVGDPSGLGLGGSVALGFVDTDTRVELDAAEDAVAAGAVELLARSEDAYDVSARVKAAADGGVGIAAAVLDAATATEARLAGDVDAAGAVTVAADSRVSSATSRAVTEAAPVAAGEEQTGGDWSGFFGSLMGRADGDAAEAMEAEDGAGGEADQAPGAGEDGGLPFEFGSSISLLWLDDSTRALIAEDAGSLDASHTTVTAGDVSVSARREVARLANQALSTTVSEAEEGGAAIALSAAVAFADVDHRTAALVGEGAVLDVQRLGVGAALSLPAAVAWGEEGAPGSLEDLEGAEAAELDAWLTSHAAAAAGGETLSLAGAVSVLLLDSDVDAGIGDAAAVTLRGAGGSWSATPAGVDDLAWADTLSVAAKAEIGTVSLVGNGASGGGVGVGGGVNWDGRRTRVDARIGTGVSLSGAGGAAPGVAVTAERADSQIAAVAVSGESGGAAGLGAAVAFGRLDVAAAARVDDAELRGVGDVRVRTEASVRSEVLAASRISAGDVGVVATLALSNVDIDDRAELVGGVEAGGDVEVVVRSAQDYRNRAVAESGGGVGLGLAAAIADRAARVEGLIDGQIIGAGNVLLLADSVSGMQAAVAETVSSDPASGDEDTPETAADSGGVADFIQARTGKAAESSKSDEAEAEATPGTNPDGGLPIQIAGAAAVTRQEDEVYARLRRRESIGLLDGARPDIDVSGDVTVVARREAAGLRNAALSRAVAQGRDAEGRGLSLGAALAVGLIDNSVVAHVGNDDARLFEVSAGRFGAAAELLLPARDDTAGVDELNDDASRGDAPPARRRPRWPAIPAPWVWPARWTISP